MKRTREGANEHFFVALQTGGSEAIFSQHMQSNEAIFESRDSLSFSRSPSLICRTLHPCWRLYIKLSGIVTEVFERTVIRYVSGFHRIVMVTISHWYSNRKTVVTSGYITSGNMFYVVGKLL